MKIDLGEIRWKIVNGIHLAQDRDQWRALVCPLVSYALSTANAPHTHLTKSVPMYGTADKSNCCSSK
jgi:hypothetical protein